jgi:hypothetical protein
LTSARASRLTTAHGQHPSATQSAIATAAHDRHLLPVVVGTSTTSKQRPRLAATATAPPPARRCPSSDALRLIVRQQKGQTVSLLGAES